MVRAFWFRGSGFGAPLTFRALVGLLPGGLGSQCLGFAVSKGSIARVLSGLHKTIAHERGQP